MPPVKVDWSSKWLTRTKPRSRKLRPPLLKQPLLRLLLPKLRLLSKQSRLPKLLQLLLPKLLQLLLPKRRLPKPRPSPIAMHAARVAVVVVAVPAVVPAVATIAAAAIVVVVTTSAVETVAVPTMAARN